MVASCGMAGLRRIWEERCEAARRIRDEFGTAKALGYLIGEKLVHFVREVDSHPESAVELSAVVEETKRIFGRREIAEYLAAIRRGARLVTHARMRRSRASARLARSTKIRCVGQRTSSSWNGSKRCCWGDRAAVATTLAVGSLAISDITAAPARAATEVAAAVFAPTFQDPLTPDELQRIVVAARLEHLEICKQFRLALS